MKYSSDSFLSKFIFHLIGLLANSLGIFTLLLNLDIFLKFFEGKTACATHCGQMMKM